MSGVLGPGRAGQDPPRPGAGHPPVSGPVGVISYCGSGALETLLRIKVNTGGDLFGFGRQVNRGTCTEPRWLQPGPHLDPTSPWYSSAAAPPLMTPWPDGEKGGWSRLPCQPHPGGSAVSGGDGRSGATPPGALAV